MYAVEALRAALGDDIAKWAQSQQRPLVDMIPVEEAVVSTRIGGEPDLAESESWPVFSEKAVFVAQIDFAEVPGDIRNEHPLPESGLLRIFAPTEADQDTGRYPLATVLFTTADTVSKASETGQSIALMAGIDYPNDAAQAADWPWDEDSYDADTYQEIIENQHRYQYLFGYPWTADKPTPEGLIPLLTLFDDEAIWNDGEVLQLFISPEDLAAGNFDAVIAEIRMPY